MNISQDNTTLDVAPEDSTVDQAAQEIADDNKLLQLDAVINFNDTTEKSVIVLKLGGDRGHKMRMHQAFVRFIQSRGELFKQKQFTVLFLESGDSLEVLSEEDMNKAGWHKKEKSLIIQP